LKKLLKFQSGKQVKLQTLIGRKSNLPNSPKKLFEHGHICRLKEQLLGFNLQNKNTFLWSFFMQKIDRFSTFPTTKISPNNTIFEMYYPD
tara:strand:- start:205 stop:474 length:270 start_codon:yes stop_codon:yes gene_type:complete